ncbi:MAG: Zn-dependent hydrolase [Gammaproteobacteria bacterium]|nr:Zn-dependent hydrolase [Gammaproteobacteria bacterium]MDD9852291.1 Zn-dependent hydrolase [Gammaproteobacteria bacterium]
MTELAVNAARLWQTITASAAIGPGRAGGLRRLTLSDADREMRDLFVAWCRDAGCTVTVDGVGNLFARRAGEDNSLPPVMVGSHLDTQIAGGKFDGVLGVLAGLEIVRTLNDRNMATRRPLEVVSWTNEEGVRFQPPMMGAAVFAGALERDWVLAQKDDDGMVFGEELRRIGYAGDAPPGGRAVDAYFELHIEQGPQLEAEGLQVGIVTGGFTTYGMHLNVHGENAHSGPTSMERRRNALVGAAMLIVGANDIGWRHHPEGRASSSRVVVWPNKYGILPDFAELTCDIRHPQPARAAGMLAELKQLIPQTEQRARVAVKVAREWTFGDVQFDAGCIGLVEAAARELQVPHKRMLSAAGHDAYHIAAIAPTAMIFTPCKDGVTHNEAEHIEPDYTVPGVNVLLHAVLARANR